MFVCSLSAALQDMPSEKVLLNADVYGGAIHCAFTKVKHHQETFHSIADLIRNEDAF
jgi:hypothetical protein